MPKVPVDKILVDNFGYSKFDQIGHEEDLIGHRKVKTVRICKDSKGKQLESVQFSGQNSFFMFLVEAFGASEFPVNDFNSYCSACMVAQIACWFWFWLLFFLMLMMITTFLKVTFLPSLFPKSVVPKASLYPSKEHMTLQGSCRSD